MYKRQIQSAVFEFNARGKGQSYMFQTHSVGGVASNITPNRSTVIDIQGGVNVGGTSINALQNITYGNVMPRTGDVLLKGEEVGKNGSLGWILSNFFSTIPGGANASQGQIGRIEFNGTNVVKLVFIDSISGNDIQNGDLTGGGITSGSQIRIKNYPDVRLNLTWQVYEPPGDPFSSTNNYVHFQVIDQIATATEAWADIVSQALGAGNPEPTIEYSNSNWKELGVIGAEAIRTGTDTIGDYKLGINTVARAPHSAYQSAWVDASTTDPRANLDVVGTAFISGKTCLLYTSDAADDC